MIEQNGLSMQGRYHNGVEAVSLRSQSARVEHIGHDCRILTLSRNVSMVHSFRASNLKDCEFRLVEDIDSASRHLENENWQVLLIDWDCKDMTVVQGCTSLRTIGIHTPIVFLGAESAFEKRQAAFYAGADDYLAQPISLEELEWKIRALARRPFLIDYSCVKVAELMLDRNNLVVTKQGSRIYLSPAEFCLLEFFMSNVGRLLLQEVIMERLWPMTPMNSQQVLRSCLKKLRSKIDTYGRPSLITNVHGIGYRFDPY